MLRGELHNRGSDGRCETCGEIFPCPIALAILAAVKNDVEQLTPARQVTDGARSGVWLGQHRREQHPPDGLAGSPHLPRLSRDVRLKPEVEPNHGHRAPASR
jgi:hypothetical protein